jgi:dihydropteroate synthase
MTQDRPTPSFKIIGVINITPDSFSDGGTLLSPESAVAKMIKLREEGADVIDIGAESSRPGAEPIGLEEEWSRLEPVLNLIQQRGIDIPMSIDTYKDDIALKVLPYNITYINNIRGLYTDQTLHQLAKVNNLNYICMHMLNSPQVMQQKPLEFRGCLDVVEDFFTSASLRLEKAGFAKDRIFMDPGIGFGKTDAANIRLLASTTQLGESFNLAVGISRKSWIGRTLTIESPKERDNPSKMMELALGMFGARLIRTHDVGKLAKLRQLLDGAREY